MSRVMIWALESDYDRETVKVLAEKLGKHLQLENISVRAAGKTDIPRSLKGQADSTLKRAVERYLQEYACVIFVIDTDGPKALHERQQQQNSLINQVKRLVSDNKFSGRVHLAQARCELEAWLLIDCIGICCYFAKNRFNQDCRTKILDISGFTNLLAKYQKGNTELITEAEMGGAGVKEYLVEFSEKVLRTINPQLKDKNIKEQKYHEWMAPDIAEHIEINQQTLRRNSSFQRLGDLLKSYNEQSFT